MGDSVAIVGGGPTAVYTAQALTARGFPGTIDVFAAGDTPGVGMPYDRRFNHPALLANIASFEIPPVGPSFADWANAQDPAALARLGIDRPLTERSFPPRVLLGDYYAAGLAALAAAHPNLRLHARTQVTDIAFRPDGVRVDWAGRAPGSRLFDHVVLASGHTWPGSDEAARGRFASPWPTAALRVPQRARVAVIGSSLSAIDAAVTLALQAGRFAPTRDGLRYDRDPAHDLRITFFSRGGILPEADFFFMVPAPPLAICTDAAVDALIRRGPQGLLDGVFDLMRAELQRADRFYSLLIGLATLTADDFAEAYFASRRGTDPFAHARANLSESRENAARRRTVAWRFALLRMHEVVAPIVPHLSPADRARFDRGLKRLFMDNYAAVPLASVERLIALNEAGVLSVERIGDSADFEPAEQGVVLRQNGHGRAFTTLIDARGQAALGLRDLPFPSLAAQLGDGDGPLPQGPDGLLPPPPGLRGQIYCAAIPFLLHRDPFVQGICETARLGAEAADRIIGDGARVAAA